ncbi:MAG: YbjQ family protein [Myxococcota bacterium]
MPITTTFVVPGQANAEVLGVVGAEAAIGMNIFKDFFTSVRDVVGGRSKSLQKVLRQARQQCLADLAEEAKALNADAVVGASFAYEQFSGQGKSMVLVVASGTAVKTVRRRPSGA